MRSCKQSGEVPAGRWQASCMHILWKVPCDAQCWLLACALAAWEADGFAWMCCMAPAFEGANLQQSRTADLLHVLMPGLQALLLQRLLRCSSAGAASEGQVPELVWVHVVVAPHEVHDAVVAQQSVDLPAGVRCLSLQPWALVRLDGASQCMWWMLQQSEGPDLNRLPFSRDQPKMCTNVRAACSRVNASGKAGCRAHTAGLDITVRGAVTLRPSKNRTSPRLSGPRSSMSPVCTRVCCPPHQTLSLSIRPVLLRK